MDIRDARLIERGFPCHQVGAETQRERGASSALPPLYFLHVWWARRPLTPSRAAIVASLDPEDTDPETFVRQLGIERVQALVDGEPWTLTGDLLGKVMFDTPDTGTLRVDAVVLRRLQQEDQRR
jgi:putative DNA methylase